MAVFTQKHLGDNVAQGIEAASSSPFLSFPKSTWRGRMRGLHSWPPMFALIFSTHAVISLGIDNSITQL